MASRLSLSVCIAFLLCLSTVQSCFLGVTVNGATTLKADPCQCTTTSTPPFRCDPRRPPQGNAIRAPLATTILLPSDASVAGTLPVAAPGQTFTLTGTDLNDRLVPQAPLTTGFLFLAPPGAPNCGRMSSAPPVAEGAPVTVAADGNSLTFTLTQAQGWTSAAVTAESEPRLLCYTFTGTAAQLGNQDAQWTGFRVATSWNCDPAAANQLCTDFNPAVGPISAFLNVEQQAEWEARSVCCKSGTGLRVGVCINPNTHSCCGVPYPRKQMKCCSVTNEQVTFPEEPCPCTRAGSQATPNDCPASEPNCCLPTKYPEFNNALTAVGQCYNTTLHRCCNTGQRYDPGIDQCCVINGLQTLNVPCPCGVDADCFGGQTVPTGSTLNQTLSNQQCCSQTEPTPWETQYCSIYANYPSGTGPYQAQRCLGTCYDRAYQLCCNGRVCISEYEQCCNNTCCNSMIGSCRQGRRSYSPGNSFNWVSFNDTYVQCTTIEQMNPIRAFWIFVLPIGLLLAALIGLALVLTFANKASNRAFTPIDRAWIIVAVLAVLLAIPLFFSPQYKYGLLVLIAGLVSILSASIRSKIMNIFAIIIILITIVFLLDPFPGNALLNMTTGRLRGGEPDPERNGVLEATRTNYRNATECPVRECIRFYDYFLMDPEVHDFDRYDNDRNHSFGYCSRGWTFALLMFIAALLILMALLFVLALLDLMRFRANDFEPIELEVHPTTPEDAIIVEH